MSALTSSQVIALHRGDAPLLISMPHAGTHIPLDIAETMTEVASYIDDCDWHLGRLYAFSKALGASLLLPSHARYVIDLNRPPDNENLYPGQDTTGLVPIDTFSKAPLYRDMRAPDAKEIERRRINYWQPYHAMLADELARLKAEHGHALLWEAHSIRSRVPRFFDGSLPDFNFGTANGISAAPGLAEALAERVIQHGGYTAVANGRFKGGYITRHYGVPEAGIHAVQLELAQLTYMEEQRPYAYDLSKAACLTPLLETLLKAALAWTER